MLEVNHFCCELSLEELSQNDAHIIVCSTHGNKEKVFVEDERGLVLGVPVAKMAQISFGIYQNRKFSSLRTGIFFAANNSQKFQMCRSQPDMNKMVIL